MTLVVYKLIAALLIFLISLISIIYPLKKRAMQHESELLHLGEALASGIFLGAAFFHLLPDAIRSFHSLYPSLAYPIPETVCISGFLLLLFLERLALFNPTLNQRHLIPFIVTFMLIIHALTEGAALGMGQSYSETLMLLIAILAHKGSESFALCLTLIRYQLSLRFILFIMVVFALMTPLGIGLGSVLNYFIAFGQGELAKALLDAFAAGTFLYISTLHHTHSHTHRAEPQGMLEFASLVSGLMAMAVIAIWN